MPYSHAHTEPFFEALEPRILLAANAYALTDLGSLGGANSFAVALNNQGQIAGRSWLSDSPVAIRAFKWIDGEMHNLGSLPGFFHSLATDINDASNVVGTAQNLPLDELAFLARPNQDVINLGTLGGNWSRVAAINETNTVVGTADTGLVTAGPGGGEVRMFHAFAWQDGLISDLGTLGGPHSAAEAINNAGQIVGWSLPNITDAMCAFLWHDGTMHDLGTLGGPGAVAHAINNDGVAIGDADIGRTDRDGFEIFHAVRWQNSEALDLGTLGGQFSSASDINDHGDIVGWAQSSGLDTRPDAASQAFIWFDGRMVNLNDRIDDNSSWVLEQATAINDHGQISGFGHRTDDPGRVHAFRMDPLLADLVPQWSQLNLPQTLIPGDSARATIRLTNQGLGPALGTVKLQIYLSRDNVFDEHTDRQLQELTLRKVKLDPADSRTDKVHLTIPADIRPGNYYLLIRVDSPDPNLLGFGQIGTSERTYEIAWKFGRFADRRGVKLALQLPDYDDATAKNVVTFKIRGAGFGEVIEDGDRYDLRLTDTTPRSAATLLTAKRLSGAHLRHIVVDGSMKQLIAKTTDLLGDVSVLGSLNRLQMRDAPTPNRISIGSSDRNRQSVTFDFKDVADLNIASEVPIRSVVASHWADNDQTADTIEAPTIGQVRITGDRKHHLAGDFGASLIVNGPAEYGDAVGRVSVAGTITGGQWTIRGNVGTIAAAAIAIHNDLENPLWSAHIHGHLKAIMVGGSAGGRIIARSVDQLSIGENLSQTHIRLTGNMGPSGTSAPVLGNLNVGRWMDKVRLESTGNIGTISAGAMRETTIFAGVQEGLTDLPASTGDFDLLASIAVVRIRGLHGQRPLLINSRIAGWEVGKVVASHGATADHDTPLGIAAHQIKALIYHDRHESLRLRRPADFLAHIDSQVVFVRLV